MFQIRLLASNSEARVWLWPPRPPVSEIDGSIAALATPIWALAAIRLSSACRMSGRRSSSDDGSPGGGTGGTGSRDSGSSLPSTASTAPGSRSVPSPVRCANAECGLNR